MSISNELRLAKSEGTNSGYDGLIMLGYAVFSIAFLVVVYAASDSFGMAPGDLALMPVFP